MPTRVLILAGWVVSVATTAVQLFETRSASTSFVDGEAQFTLVTAGYFSENPVVLSLDAFPQRGFVAREDSNPAPVGLQIEAPEVACDLDQACDLQALCPHVAEPCEVDITLFPHFPNDTQSEEESVEVELFVHVALDTEEVPGLLELRAR